MLRTKIITSGFNIDLHRAIVSVQAQNAATATHHRAERHELPAGMLYLRLKSTIH